MEESLVKIIKKCQNLSKDEKLKYLTEQLYEGLSTLEITQDNYLKMQKIIIELAKANFDVENVNIYFTKDFCLDFSNMRDESAYSILLNVNFFSYVSNSITENIKRLASLLITLSHELLTSEYSQSKKTLPDFLKKMIQEHPDREKYYYELELILTQKSTTDDMNAVYQSHVFAQQSVDFLNKIFKQKFPDHKKIEEKTNKLSNTILNQNIPIQQVLRDCKINKKDFSALAFCENHNVMKNFVLNSFHQKILEFASQTIINAKVCEILKQEVDFYNEKLLDVSNKCGNLSKEDQLTYLASKIWSCLYLTDYDNLQNESSLDKKTFTKDGVYVGQGAIISDLIVKYIQTSFDAQNIPVLFEPGLKGVGGFDPVTEKIYLNSDIFSFYDLKNINYGTIADLLVTLSHELIHAKDFFANGKNLLLYHKTTG